jgi:transcriptional regulator with XRE-family HTH domain
MKKIGRKIEEARLEARLTRKKLGELIDKSDTHIYRYETGMTNIPMSEFLKIAKVLNKRPSWFLEEISEEFEAQNSDKKYAVEIIRQLKEEYANSVDNVCSLIENNFENFEKVINRQNEIIERFIEISERLSTSGAEQLVQVTATSPAKNEEKEKPSHTGQSLNEYKIDNVLKYIEEKLFENNRKISKKEYDLKTAGQLRTEILDMLYGREWDFDKYGKSKDVSDIIE